VLLAAVQHPLDDLECTKHHHHKEERDGFHLYLPLADESRDCDPSLRPGQSPTLVALMRRRRFRSTDRSRRTWLGRQLAAPEMSHSNGVRLARARIPALVLIRPPEDAVLSLATSSPHVGLDRALHAYSRFYERIQPHHASCVTGEFTQVTTDLGAVIDAVNARYATTFARFEHTPANVQACYGLIEEKSRRPPWAAAITRYVSGTITADELAAARAAAGGNGGAGELSESRATRPRPSLPWTARARSPCSPA
jgi:hypothetical protein